VSDEEHGVESYIILALPALILSKEHDAKL
jgi:hypothetical protein